jgi:hypothetical protein
MTVGGGNAITPAPDCIRRILPIACVADATVMLNFI